MKNQFLPKISNMYKSLFTKYLLLYAKLKITSESIQKVFFLLVLKFKLYCITVNIRLLGSQESVLKLKGLEFKLWDSKWLSFLCSSGYQVLKSGPYFERLKSKWLTAIWNPDIICVLNWPFQYWTIFGYSDVHFVFKFDWITIYRSLWKLPFLEVFRLRMVLNVWQTAKFIFFSYEKLTPGLISQKMAFSLRFWLKKWCNYASFSKLTCVSTKVLGIFSFQKHTILWSNVKFLLYNAKPKLPWQDSKQKY
jgi:hypothetical protein